MNKRALGLTYLACLARWSDQADVVAVDLKQFDDQVCVDLHRSVLRKIKDFGPSNREDIISRMLCCGIWVICSVSVSL